MFGMYSDMKPKFVKQYSQLGAVIKQGCEQYINETKAMTFPASEHTFAIDEEVIKKLY